MAVIPKRMRKEAPPRSEDRLRAAEGGDRGPQVVVRDERTPFGGEDRPPLRSEALFPPVEHRGRDVEFSTRRAHVAQFLRLAEGMERNPGPIR